MFKIVRTKASPKIIQFGSWFFLIAGTFGIVISLFEFIRSFPNGFSPMLSCVMGMWLAILTDVDKHKD